jgi:aryl-alcohol dehydrogenase-like predicted oxidoreductase
MRTRPIGALDVSVVGLGCNNFGGRIDAAATESVIDAALDAGINHFDTADIYAGGESERLIGRFLQGRRDRVILATKFGHTSGGEGRGGHPDHVRRALAESLERLRTDYVDLYILHRPDASVPIADTLGALADAVRAGQVREIGCSGFSAAQLEEADAAAGEGAPRFVCLQNEYSLIEREAERDELPACERLGVAFVPYFPLASGLLTGKYRRGQEPPEGTRITGSPRQETLLTDENLDLVEDLVAFAEARGRTLLDLAFAWLLARPAVASVIAGATSAEQVRRNAATADWEMTPEEMREVERLLAARGVRAG